MWDLKATHMNVQHSQIYEFLRYEFKLGHKAAEATKSICASGEVAVDHNTVTRWLKKFVRIVRISTIKQGQIGLKL